MKRDRLRLFKMTATILILTGIVSFLMRYYVMSGQLKTEFLFPLGLVFIGGFVRYLAIEYDLKVQEHEKF